MAKAKTQFIEFEIGQSVQLARPILRYADVYRGVEFDPPQVLFPEGSAATILDKQGNSYLLSLADGAFRIRRHASSLVAAKEVKHETTTKAFQPDFSSAAEYSRGG